MSLLPVNCRAQYLTAPVSDMRAADYNATHLVKAVKGLDLHPNSYAYVSIGGARQRIAESTKDKAMDWFAEWAAQQVNSLGADQAKIIVPVPSSKSTPDKPADFRTAVIAQKVAALCKNTQVASLLRFKTERPNSREEGGSRSADDLYEELTLTGPLPKGKIILLDDVMTGGGHLTASAWKIEDQDRDVDLAVCCGRSIDHQMDDPFAVPSERLDLTRSPF